MRAESLFDRSLAPAHLTAQPQLHRIVPARHLAERLEQEVESLAGLDRTHEENVGRTQRQVVTRKEIAVEGAVGVEDIELHAERRDHDGRMLRKELFHEASREVADRDQHARVLGRERDRSTKERDLGALVPLGIGKESELMNRYEPRRRATSWHRVVRAVPEIDFF